ncbi:hypothetical protein ACWOFR_17065 [Carnobacterium gallinarum]|uniref:hypothetical protein n=1 Tax=Carnobacterium gallinarum TaxID=2749 RepID=UPI000A87C66A|nr:hypothetical protein [Carnobacterium gallinarum]
MKKSKFSIISMLVMSMFIIGACGASGGSKDSSNNNSEYETAMREGKQNIGNQNYSEAETAFNEALNAKSKDATATTYLEQTKNYQAAEAAYKKGELAEAKTQVEKVTAETKGSNDLVKAGKKLATMIETLTTQKANYQKLYDDSQAQYNAGKLNEAAGTIDELLAKDLSNELFTELKTKATNLKTEINQAQAEKVKEEQAIVPNSKYKKERNSELIGKEFATATGLDIKTASDDQIAEWLSKQESTVVASNTATTTDSSATDSSANASSSASSADSTDSSTSSDNSVVLTDPETIKVIQAVEKMTGISSSENQYYVTKSSGDVYQVEIRRDHTVGDTEISNMVGMFEYTTSTNSLSKMDPITGDYNPFQKLN